MKRSRSHNKDVREHLKQAALRDRDLDREMADDWAAVDRESWQQRDREEKHTAGRSAGKVKRTRSLREIKAYIHKIAPTPEWLKAMQQQAKRNGLDKLTMRKINAEIAAAQKEARERKSP
jgi:hypothetical protein